MAPQAKHQGYSLIEMAIVLAVAGFIMSGVWVVVQKGSLEGRTRQALIQIIALNKNIRSFYANQPCILATGNLTGTLAGTAPPVILREMLVGGGAVNLWGQPFFVLRNGVAGCTDGVNPQRPYQYVLRYQGLPPDACVSLATKATAPGEASRGLVAVTINTVALNLPITATAINGTAAGQCGENPTAILDLTYNLRMGE